VTAAVAAVNVAAAAAAAAAADADNDGGPMSDRDEFLDGIDDDSEIDDDDYEEEN